MPPLLYLIIAFLLGLLFEWALEIFFFRRRMFDQIDADKRTIASLRASSKDAAELQTQLDKAKVDLNACSGARANLQTQFDELKMQFGKAEAEVKATASAKASVDKKLGDLETQLAQAKADLSETTRARMQLGADLKVRDAELAKLHADLDGHLSQNKSLTADVAKFTAGAATATATIKSLEGDKASLAQQIADLKARLDKANADLSALANARAQANQDLKAREAELAKVRADLDGHLSQNKSLTADVAKFTAGAATATATIKTLEGDKAGLAQQIIGLKAQLDKADAELSASARLRAQADLDVKAREAELAKVRAELDGHLSQNKSLTADVAKFTAGAATAVATIKTLEGDKAGLEVQVGRLKGELDDCARARAALEVDLKSREEEIGKLRIQTAPVLAVPAVAAPAPVTLTAPEREQPVETEVLKLKSRGENDETPFVTACPQHLSDVKGIGTVFETRLYEAGVGSYWELAQLSNADLKRILKVTDLQAGRVDLNAIRSDARRLAKESKSLGRKWSGFTPDDFEPLEGIGHTFEKRLYDAGICTYESLARASVELLDEVCQAPARFKPDYAAWIKQAKALAAKKAKRPQKA